MPEQHVDPVMAAEYCTPDQMAECMANVSDELYRTLWIAISDHEKEYGVKDYEEPMDMYEDISLAAMWGRFTNAERAQINEVLIKDPEKDGISATRD